MIAPAILPAQRYYSKAIDLDDHGRERIKKFIATDSLIYASTGQRCEDNDCTSLVKMDLEGNVIDFRLFPWLDGGDQEYILLDEATVVISGHKGWFENAGYCVQICNLELDSLKMGLFTTADSVKLMANKSIIKYAGEFVITGFTRPLDDINWPTDLFWLNADLSLDSTVRLHLGNQATSFNEAVIDSNGLLNILYEYDSSDDTGFHRGIIRFNSEKEIVGIWETPFQNTTTIIENMVLLNNGNFVIMEQDDVNDYMLMFMSYNGDFLMSAILESTGYDSKTPIEIRVARNGDILGCGVYQSTQTDTFGCCIYTGYIFRMSPDGTLLWERIIIDYDSTGQYMDGTFTDIRELPNGDLLLGGDIEALHLPEHDSDMWLVRTDSMGCLKPGCGEIQVVTGVREVPDDVPNINELMYIYPNPASAELHINVGNNFQYGQVNFQIWNMHGALQLTDTLSEGINTLNISSMPPGLYCISFALPDRTVLIDRFIKN
jgi:hypothetical protein